MARALAFALALTLLLPVVVSLVLSIATPSTRTTSFDFAVFVVVFPLAVLVALLMRFRRGFLAIFSARRRTLLAVATFMLVAAVLRFVIVVAAARGFATALRLHGTHESNLASELVQGTKGKNPSIGNLFSLRSHASQAKLSTYPEQPYLPGDFA